MTEVSNCFCSTTLYHTLAFSHMKLYPNTLSMYILHFESASSAVLIINVLSCPHILIRRHTQWFSVPTTLRTIVSRRTEWMSLSATPKRSTQNQTEYESPDWGGKGLSPVRNKIKNYVKRGGNRPFL